MGMGRGEAAYAFLHDQGLQARTPLIHAGDATFTCPFQYYLERRLGLTPAVVAEGEALSIGRWMHVWFELFDQPGAEHLWQRRLQEHEDTVNARADAAGLERPDAHASKERAYYARTWFDAAVDYQFPNGSGTLRQMLERYTTIGREIAVTVKDAQGMRHRATFDRLMHDPHANTVHVVDLKSCSGSTVARAETCAVEFQHVHYMQVLKQAMREGLIKNWPCGAVIGRMIHLLIRKPGIRLNKTADANSWVEVNPETNRKRTVRGEPSWARYAERVAKWYEDQVDPPVNRCKSPMPDDDLISEYETEMHRVRTLAAQAPWPCLFPRTSVAGMIGRGHDVGVYAGFYKEPVEQWPRLVRENRLVQSWRGEPEVD